MKTHVLKCFLFLFVCGICLSPFSNAFAENSRYDDARQYTGVSEWHEKKVRQYEELSKTAPPPQGCTMFVGSSTWAGWGKTFDADFKGMDVVNRGFGGSITPEWHYALDRLVTPYKPARIMFFCGTNDLNYRHSPERIVSDFKKFLSLLRETNPDCMVFYVSITKSHSRKEFWEDMDKVNDTIKEMAETDKHLVFIDANAPLYGTDGVTREEYFGDRLHLNRQGQQIWIPILREAYFSNFHGKGNPQKDRDATSTTTADQSKPFEQKEIPLVSDARGDTPRNEFLLEKNWKFSKGDHPEAIRPAFSDENWESVEVPHDWAIYGPFDLKNDEQDVAITANFEESASMKTGRTGGLPFVGVGWYRTKFDLDRFQKDKRRISVLFEGAMSEARVYLNGKEVGFWPYGYNSFHFDVTDYINESGKDNILAVRLENRPESSRWYPGAGLYRNVRIIETESVHVPVWGTYVTTPFVSKEYASVCLKINIENVRAGELVRVFTEIFDPDGNKVTSKDDSRKIFRGEPFVQNFIVDSPERWAPETPNLYKAVTKIHIGDENTDEYTTRFGIREIRFVPEKGFFLNGDHRKFKGVCNHHDLGPLGAAVNKAALRRQLVLLKEMGCDSIRTSHNMPAPDLISLCDEMGFMVIAENFDEWDMAKCKNGYHRFFNDWAEKDMVNMLHHFRNNPSIVMWSIGNEVGNQWKEGGDKVAVFLNNICKREDPTRPTTCGMDQVKAVIHNGFATVVDIPGFNYRTQHYLEAYDVLPQNMVLGAETASTVSSRGVYKFPVQKKADAKHADFQSSSYDLEYCPWSNIPDEDFALADDYPWTLGQFVWTGFDYLGEPTPYDSAESPNHSSMFGVIDLAGIPKDRYYLYRSLWNEEQETLHVLPHWNWEGREGEKTPVFVYTNHPSAEVFVNGKSFGKRTKNRSDLLQRYRLMWMDVVYEPGELKVVAYDVEGKEVAQKSVHTAGKPDRIELIPDRTILSADGKDLAYINVRIVDQDGNPCPLDQRLVEFKVEGAGKFRAVANGDPTSLELFHLPKMHVFNGQLTAIVQAGKKKGEMVFVAESEGIQSAKTIFAIE